MVIKKNHLHFFLHLLGKLSFGEFKHIVKLAEEGLKFQETRNETGKKVVLRPCKQHWRM